MADLFNHPFKPWTTKKVQLTGIELGAAEWKKERKADTITN
jgi:hypothetical protein